MQNIHDISTSSKDTENATDVNIKINYLNDKIFESKIKMKDLIIYKNNQLYIFGLYNSKFYVEINKQSTSLVDKLIEIDIDWNLFNTFFNSIII